MVVVIHRDPRPTNRAIRESVEEKFGVGVDDRTIRRYCEAARLPTGSRKTLPGSKAGGRPDPELGPHRRGLFYFGKLLRDLLNLPLWHELSQSTVDINEYGMWHPVPSSGELAPQNEEERDVARYWDFIGYDAKQHPLFGAFKEHLPDCDRWDTLKQAESEFRKYVEAYTGAYEAVKKAVARSLPGLAGQDSHVMVETLFWHALFTKCGVRPGEFSYELRKATNAAGEEGWRLKLQNVCTRVVPDRAQLEPLVAVHRQLFADPPYDAELHAVVAAYDVTTDSIQKFQEALRPDDRLRKLILNGHCDLCP